MMPSAQESRGCSRTLATVETPFGRARCGDAKDTSANSQNAGEQRATAGEPEARAEEIAVDSGRLRCVHGTLWSSRCAVAEMYVASASSHGMNRVRKNPVSLPHALAGEGVLLMPAKLPCWNGCHKGQPLGTIARCRNPSAAGGRRGHVRAGQQLSPMKAVEVRPSLFNDGGDGPCIRYPGT